MTFARPDGLYQRSGLLEDFRGISWVVRREERQLDPVECEEIEQRCESHLVSRVK